MLCCQQECDVICVSCRRSIRSLITSYLDVKVLYWSNDSSERLVLTGGQMRFSPPSSPSTQLIKPLSVFHPHAVSCAVSLSILSKSSSLCSDTTNTVKVNRLCLWDVIRVQESTRENERRLMFPSRAQNLNCVLWKMCDGGAVTQSGSFQGEKHESYQEFRSSSNWKWQGKKGTSVYAFDCCQLVCISDTQFLYFFLMIESKLWSHLHTNHHTLAWNMLNYS